MTSTSTEYRARKIDLIGQIIIKLAHVLTLEKRQIDKIKLPLLKKAYKDIDTIFAQSHNFPRIEKNNLIEVSQQIASKKNLKAVEKSK